jgi:arylsulfatase A-like enzyme
MNSYFYCFLFLIFCKISAAQQNPNVIFILADDMGYGDVSCLNSNSKISTPNIDKLAREGKTFIDAHSPASLCTPTRYAILTGRYGWRSSLKKGVLKHYDPPLIEEGRFTIGQLFKENNYNTACIGKWHLGVVAK